MDECGVCGGTGSTCALRASVRLSLPADYRYPEDMDSLGFDKVFSWLASSVLVHVGGLAVSPEDVKVKSYVPVPQDRRRRQLLQSQVGCMLRDGCETSLSHHSSPQGPDSL